MPVLFTVAARHLRWRLAGLSALGLALLMNVALQAPMRVAYGWHSLSRHDRADSMHRFLQLIVVRAGSDLPGAASDGDAKLGMYRLLQAGGAHRLRVLPGGHGHPELHQRARLRGTAL